MSLRDKIENNLAIWLLAVLSTGFAAGIGAYKAVLEMAQLEVISKSKLESLQSAALNGQGNRGGDSNQAEDPDEASGSQNVSSSQLPDEPDVTLEPRKLPQKLPIFEAKSSSFRRAALNFPSRNVINNIIKPQYNRSWQSEQGDTVGAWLELYLPQEHAIGKIRVYMLIDDSSRGGQIRDAKLNFSDGSVQEVRFPFEQGWQSIDLKKIETDLVRLEVLSVYPGNSGIDNLEVVEIELYGD